MNTLWPVKNTTSQNLWSRINQLNKIARSGSKNRAKSGFFFGGVSREILKTWQEDEEEEGTGVASDVVKVQGEDAATPGPLP